MYVYIYIYIYILFFFHLCRFFSLSPITLIFFLLPSSLFSLISSLCFNLCSTVLSLSPSSLLFSSAFFPLPALYHYSSFFYFEFLSLSHVHPLFSYAYSLSFSPFIHPFPFFFFCLPYTFPPLSADSSHPHLDLVLTESSQLH